MSITPEGVRATTLPRVTRVELLVLAALLVLTLAVGVALGRATSSSTTRAGRSAAAAASVRWLDDTPSYRTAEMTGMNRLPHHAW